MHNTSPQGAPRSTTRSARSSASIQCQSAGWPREPARLAPLHRPTHPPLMRAAALVRLVVPVVFISAWLNNTPVVLILIPIVASWSRKAGLAPGHLYMPLSFASILGGTTTLIGTSTNLVIAGKQRDSFPDDPPLRLFNVTPYGVPVAMAGMLYLVLLAPSLLPGKAKTAAPCAAHPLPLRPTTGSAPRITHSLLLVPGASTL